MGARLLLPYAVKSNWRDHRYAVLILRRARGSNACPPDDRACRRDGQAVPAWRQGQHAQVIAAIRPESGSVGAHCLEDRLEYVKEHVQSRPRLCYLKSKFTQATRRHGFALDSQSTQLDAPHVSRRQGDFAGGSNNVWITATTQATWSF